VTGDDVAIVGELLFANTADAVLGDDLPVEQLPHFPVRAQLSIPAGMLRIVDALHTKLAFASSRPDNLPATAESGSVNGINLVAMEFHGSALFSLSSSVDC